MGDFHEVVFIGVMRDTSDGVVLVVWYAPVSFPVLFSPPGTGAIAIDTISHDLEPFVSVRFLRSHSPVLIRSKDLVSMKNRLIQLEESISNSGSSTMPSPVLVETQEQLLKLQASVKDGFGAFVRQQDALHTQILELVYAWCFGFEL